MSDDSTPEILAAQALAELMLFYPEWLEMQRLRESRTQEIVVKTFEAFMTAESAREFLRMRRGMQGLN